MARAPHNILQATRRARWIYLAGLLLALSGIFHAVIGGIALLNDNIHLADRQSLIIFSYAGWGWVNLILGLVLLSAVIGVLREGRYGRIAGLIAATLSALTTFAFLGDYPVWEFIVIAVDVFVACIIVLRSTEAYTTPRK